MHEHLDLCKVQRWEISLMRKSGRLNHWHMDSIKIKQSLISVQTAGGLVGKEPQEVLDLLNPRLQQVPKTLSQPESRRTKWESMFGLLGSVWTTEGTSVFTHRVND